jgi:hypothetical protein
LFQPKFLLTICCAKLDAADCTTNIQCAEKKLCQGFILHISQNKKKLSLNQNCQKAAKTFQNKIYLPQIVGGKKDFSEVLKEMKVFLAGCKFFHTHNKMYSWMF